MELQKQFKVYLPLPFPIPKTEENQKREKRPLSEFCVIVPDSWLTFRKKAVRSPFAFVCLFMYGIDI